MKALGWWLMLLGILRLASVWFGFFDIWALRLAVFSQTEMFSTLADSSLTLQGMVTDLSFIKEKLSTKTSSV
ncbi:hypothetical protein KSS87_023376 [Heliosperma pusillum]|nr:hypothetical protein KSS87_023376 [Heliosperma pusillum]